MIQPLSHWILAILTLEKLMHGNECQNVMSLWVPGSYIAESCKGGITLL